MSDKILYWFNASDVLAALRQNPTGTISIELQEKSKDMPRANVFVHNCKDINGMIISKAHLRVVQSKLDAVISVPKEDQESKRHIKVRIDQLGDLGHVLVELNKFWVKNVIYPIYGFTEDDGPKIHPLVEFKYSNDKKVPDEYRGKPRTHPIIKIPINFTKKDRNGTVIPNNYPDTWGPSFKGKSVVQIRDFSKKELAVNPANGKTTIVYSPMTAVDSVTGASVPINDDNVYSVVKNGSILKAVKLDLSSTCSSTMGLSWTRCGNDVLIYNMPPQDTQTYYEADEEEIAELKRQLEAQATINADSNTSASGINIDNVAMTPDINYDVDGF